MKYNESISARAALLRALRAAKLREDEIRGPISASCRDGLWCLNFSSDWMSYCCYIDGQGEVPGFFCEPQPLPGAEIHTLDAAMAPAI